MKTIVAIVISCVAFSFGMGSSNVPPIEEIDLNERDMSHINYIQYELAKIRQSADKFTATYELDNVLRHIEPTSIKNKELSNAYENILNSMVEIRATDEQKKALAKELAAKRKNAIFSSFSGLGAAFLNPNPVSLASALIMSGFNYARTVNEIDIEGDKESLKLSQTQRDRIDKQRIDLWKSASIIFKDSKYESTTFINDKKMSTYLEEDFKLEKALDSENAAKEARGVYTYLSIPEVENQFRFFIPYYVTLLKTGYAEKNTERIKKYYKKIVELSNAEYKHFYTRNLYLYEATKYVLLYLMQENVDNLDGMPINEMINIIKKEGDKDSRVSVIEDDYYLVGIYEFLEKRNKGQYSDEIKNVLQQLVDFGIENDTTDLYSKYKCLESSNHENKYCYRLAKKIATDQLKKTEYVIDKNSLFLVSPFDGEVSANCTDRLQKTIVWGALDRQDERQRCNEIVSQIHKEKVNDLYEFKTMPVFPLEHVKINVTFNFKMGEWKGVARGIVDWKGELQKNLELTDFKK